MSSANTWDERFPRPVPVTPVPRYLPAAMAALCVAAGILLAVIGDAGHGDAAPAVTGPAPADAPVAATAAAHRKAVFDARRARFDAAHGSNPDLAVRH